MSVEERLLKSAVVDGMRMDYYADLSTHEKPTAADMTTAREIFRVLKAHYPGHPWSVEVHAAQGWAKIGLAALLGPNWGWMIHLDAYTDQDIVKAGGEILERFRIPRSKIDIAAYMSADSKIPLLGCFRAKDRHRIPA